MHPGPFSGVAPMSFIVDLALVAHLLSLNLSAWGEASMTCIYLCHIIINSIVSVSFPYSILLSMFHQQNGGTLKAVCEQKWRRALVAFHIKILSWLL